MRKEIVSRVKDWSVSLRGECGKATGTGVKQAEVYYNLQWKDQGALLRR